jgi:hypothetical protein
MSGGQSHVQLLLFGPEIRGFALDALVFASPSECSLHRGWSRITEFFNGKVVRLCVFVRPFSIPVQFEQLL